MKKLALFLWVLTLILSGCGQSARAETLPITNSIDTIVVAPTTSTSLPPTATVIDTPVPTAIVIPTLTTISVASNGLILDARTVIAMQAATQAAATMPGPYSWAENRHCSSYIAEYMRELGFPVNGPFSHNSEYSNAFPWSNVVSQVKWLRENYPASVNDAPLIDFLNGKLWNQIKPGSIVYLPLAIGHNGYNTYYHVAVLIGYHTDGSPQFAEFAGIMKIGASVNSSLWEMANFYPILPTGGWDVTPYKTGSGTPPPLMVTWIDPLTIQP